MGSFANSVHVKSKDAQAVAQAVERILGRHGYHATDIPPDLEAWDEEAEARRAIWIGQPRNGWTAVLDSSVMGDMTLAEELSRELATQVLAVMVNDSDSWHYLLYHLGQLVDSFDSMAEWGEADEDEAPDELGSEATDVLKRFWGGQMQSLWPPEILAIIKKANAGTATPEEIEQYVQWTQEHAEKFTQQLQQTAENLMSGGLDKPRDSATLQPHAQALMPLVPSGVSEERLIEVLGQQAVFAEEVLRTFLDQLGITPSYADLSYAYLKEDESQESLADLEIEPAYDLQFERAS